MGRQEAHRRSEVEGRDDTASLPTFAPGNEVIGYRVRRAQVAIFARFNAAFADLQIRPVEYSILMMIRDNPGRKQTDIAHSLGLNRANFVPIIDGLQARNLIERRSTPDDRRINTLHLTEAGETFVAEVCTRHEVLEKEFTLRLGGKARRQQLMEMLALLVDLSPSPGDR